MSIPPRTRVEYLDIPTFIRRAWADPQPALGLADKVKALWINFLARVGVSEIFWR